MQQDNFTKGERQESTRHTSKEARCGQVAVVKANHTRHRRLNSIGAHHVDLLSLGLQALGPHKDCIFQKFCGYCFTLSFPVCWRKREVANESDFASQEKMGENTGKCLAKKNRAALE